MELEEIIFENWTILSLDINNDNILLLVKKENQENLIIFEKDELNKLNKNFKLNNKNYYTIFNLQTKNILKSLFFSNYILIVSEDNKIILLEDYLKDSIKEKIFNWEEENLLISVNILIDSKIGLLYYDNKLKIYEINYDSIYLIIVYHLNSYFSNIYLYENYLLNFSNSCIFKNFKNNLIINLKKNLFEEVNNNNIHSINKWNKISIDKILKKIYSKKKKNTDDDSILINDYIELWDEMFNIISNKFLMIDDNILIIINISFNKIWNIIDIKNNNLICNLLFNFEIKKIYNLKFNNLFLITGNDYTIIIFELKVFSNNIDIDIKYKIDDLDNNLVDINIINEKEILIWMENEKLFLLKIFN